MTPTRWTMFFLVVTHAALLVSAMRAALSRENADALRVMSALTLGWWIGIIAHMLIGPSFRTIYPFLDLALIVWCWFVHVRRTGRMFLSGAPYWLLIVMGSLALQLTRHLTYDALAPLYQRLGYLVSTDALYAVQAMTMLILCVWPILTWPLAKPRGSC